MNNEEAPIRGLIRLAEPGDEASLYDILKASYADNGVFSFSEAKVRAYVADAINRKSALALVIDGPEGIAAVLALALCQFWYSEEWLLSERVLFVRPEYRRGKGSKYAQDLIKAAEALSDRWGVAYCMGVFTLERVKAKMRLFGQRMIMVGGEFIHGANRAHGPLAETIGELEAKRGMR